MTVLPRTCESLNKSRVEVKEKELKKLSAFTLVLIMIFLIFSVLMWGGKAESVSPTIVSINDGVITAAPSVAYFIFANPDRMHDPEAAYDVVTGGILFGLCVNEQYICFDSNETLVVQSGNDKGRVLQSNSAILLFGGPCPCWAVKYYEDSGLSPVKFHDEAGQFYFVTQQDDILASLPSDTDFSNSDLFLVEAFMDANGNSIYIIYGFTWRGTWAGGIYFHDIIYSNINDYINSYYIFCWTDLNNDGVPQHYEIEEVTSG